MDISREIVQLLKNEELLLQKRINLARNAFMSNRLPVQAKDHVIGSKEEVSLEWLCSVIDEGLASEEAWDALQQCLSSNRIKGDNLYISLSARSLLVSALCKLMKDNIGLSLTTEQRVSLVACSVQLIDVPIFNQHFCHNLSDYSLLMGAVLKCLNDLRTECLASLCRKLSHSLAAFARKFYLHDNFRDLFSCNILLPLSLLLEKEEPFLENHWEIVKEFHRCVQLTFFPRKKLREEQDLIAHLLFHLVKEVEVTIKPDVTLIQILSNASQTLKPDDFIPLLSVLFKSYISSCPKDAETHCQVFLLLCYLLGCKPGALNDRPSFSNDVNNFFCVPTISFSKRRFFYRSLKELLGALSGANVSVNVEVVGYPFMGWLRGLCECVISGLRTVDEPTISVMTALSELDPNILDAHTLSVIGPVMMRRSNKSKRAENNKPAYNLFLTSLLHSSVKLHRVQKLASRLLSSAKEELSDDPSLGSKVTVEDIFPPVFCAEYRLSMQHLRVTQALAMLRTLMFHFLEDCVVPMEDGRQGPSAILLLQLTKCLFCEFMVGYKAIDPNIPEHQTEKFISLMSELGSCLGRLGRALLLEKHSPNTMGAFLELSLCWGDLYLLLLFYKPDKPCSADDSATGNAVGMYPSLHASIVSPQFGGNLVGSATDFSCLHPHLTEGEWSHLVERIVNFGDESCKEMLDELVLQKLRTLVLFGPSQDAKATSCVQHLLTRAGQSSHALLLLVENQAVTVPLLNSADINILLGLCMPNSPADSSGCHFKELCNNPSIVPVATLTMLKQIAENGLKCDKNHEKESRKRRRSESGENEVGEEVGGGERGGNAKGLVLAQQLLGLVADAVCEVTGVSDASPSLNTKRLRRERKSAGKLCELMASKLNEFFESQDSVTVEVTRGRLEVDVSVLGQLLRTLNSLPLPHLSDEWKIVVSLCLVTILIVSRGQSQMSEWVDVEILATQALLLTLRASSMLRQLVSYLDIGKFLALYISANVADAYHQCTPESRRELTKLQGSLMEKMVELSTSRTAGLKQMKMAVKAVKARLKDGAADMDQVYHLASLLMSAFSKKCRRSSSEKLLVKQFCDKCHGSLAICLLRRLDFSHSKLTRELLVCFYMVLERFIMLKDQKRLCRAGRSLKGIIQAVKRRLLTGDSSNASKAISSCHGVEISDAQAVEFDSCCIEFMEKLMLMRVQLKDWCPPMFAWSMWQLLLSIPTGELDRTKLFAKALKALVLNANKKEFVLLCNDILEKMMSVNPTSVNPDLLHRYMTIWGILVHVPLVKGLAEIRQVTLKASIPVLLGIIRHWQKSSAGTSAMQAIVSTLELEQTLLKSHKVTVSHNMIDLVLISISAVPLNDPAAFSASKGSDRVGCLDGLLQFQQVFLSCSNALLALVTHQLGSLIDRIPIFLQQLLRLFRSVVMHGNVEFNPVGGLQGGKLSKSLVIMTDCGMSIEWLCSALVRHKKDFTRVSPYVISNMVASFEDHVVHPNVKVHLHNCIYVFIYFCDSSGLAFLQHTMPAGAREVFKGIFENYKKYYKFKGKI